MTSKIRIGSWPGSNFEGNDFIKIFCRSICEDGAAVVDVADPRSIDADSLDVLQIHWLNKYFGDAAYLLRSSTALGYCSR